MAEEMYVSKDLEHALEQVRTDHEEAVKFSTDPEGYLKAKGIDTEGMKFGPAELSDAALEQVAGGMARDVVGICGSVGCVGCITVGDGAASAL